MNAFREHTGLVAPLDRANVDTDQIIPKQFLKRIERSGYGQFLFFDWRFLPDGSPNPEFVLNRPAYGNASILVAGRNFGSGSSREHAAWALADYGFRAIIAPSFADIFSTNAGKNGLLIVVLAPEQVDTLMQRAGRAAEPGGQVYSLTVSLVDKTVTDSSGWSASFEIDDFRRECLLQGLDDIGLSLRHADAIAGFEAKRAARGW